VAAPPGAVQEERRIQIEGDGENPGAGSSGAEESGDQQSTGGKSAEREARPPNPGLLPGRRPLVAG